MNAAKKPLAIEEQALLLTTLLFARKHLDEILSFLPEQQSARLHEAKLRFLKLEQEERITQIIRELRRLLLIKEQNIRWIHKSWINEELNKEPAYLQHILKQCLSDKSKVNNTILSADRIMQSFFMPFLRTPQKIALFDPVLMRLQSLNRTNQEQSIANIGQYALSALSHALHRRRFIKYLMRNYQNDLRLALDYISPEENPLAFSTYKEALLNLVIKSHGQSLSALALGAGLMTMALYLSSEKARWHRMIELVLARNHGLKLRAYLETIKNDQPDCKAKTGLQTLLIDAMAHAFG